jgi:hypothetical protein
MEENAAHPADGRNQKPHKKPSGISPIWRGNVLKWAEWIGSSFALGEDLFWKKVKGLKWEEWRALYGGYIWQRG